LFYALVLTQGALFLLCFAVAVIRSLLAAQLNFLYHLKQGHLEQPTAYHHPYLILIS
jgi:hypothetical protein